VIPSAPDHWRAPVRTNLTPGATRGWPRQPPGDSQRKRHCGGQIAHRGGVCAHASAAWVEAAARTCHVNKRFQRQRRHRRRWKRLPSQPARPEPTFTALRHKGSIRAAWPGRLPYGHVRHDSTRQFLPTC
jgi:hypothetical protein